MIKSFEEANKFLLEKLPMFSRVGAVAVKKGLDNIIRLCDYLDNPQQKFKTIHIAGSNGKGSVSHILASVLQTCGYKTALYTSPHLIDIRERFRINGNIVSEQWLVDFLNQNMPIINEVNPSYFELNVAMAFQAFAEQNVDVAVIETGLGGRLDSTNIIHPVLSVITNISLEHTDMLGNSLEEIAKEKAGIIKNNTPVVIGETQTETEQVFFIDALNKNAPIIFADTIWDIVRTQTEKHYQHLTILNKTNLKMYKVITDLVGDYQIHNIKTVLAACHKLIDNGWVINMQQITEALSKVKTITGLSGRWELVAEKPDIILDVAHNPAGLAYLSQNINHYEQKGKWHIILGFVKDKNVAGALQYFPEDAIYYFTQAQVPRALPVAALMQIAQDKNLNGNRFDTVIQAVKCAMDNCAQENTILITGSFFIVGEAKAYLQNLQKHI